VAAIAARSAIPVERILTGLAVEAPTPIPPTVSHTCPLLRLAAIKTLSSENTLHLYRCVRYRACNMDALIRVHFPAAEAIPMAQVTVEEVATAAQGAPTVERVPIGRVAEALILRRHTARRTSPLVRPLRTKT
jgi:hypothetical protein